MSALEETLPADKDKLLPYINLQPWGVSRQFENTMARVEAAVGHRPIIVDLAIDSNPDTRRPVHDTLDILRDSRNGYANWYAFLQEHENYIPAVQLTDLDELASQLDAVQNLNRGAVFRLTEQMFRFAPDIARQFRGVDDESSLLFVLDFQRQNRELLNRAAASIALAEGIRAELASAFISFSASTFPDSFVDLTHQDIFERRFFNLVVDQLGTDNTIYCDHGSVRAEREGGGGGAPAPRIDNARPHVWHFFREADEEDRPTAYQMAASAAMRSASWHNLGIWGTQQIRITAAGGGAIESPVRSTAVRINIHLHAQGNYGDGPAPEESTWSD